LRARHENLIFKKLENGQESLSTSNP
jgi:hypothetical protein